MILTYTIIFGLIVGAMLSITMFFAYSAKKHDEKIEKALDEAHRKADKLSKSLFNEHASSAGASNLFENNIDNELN